MTAGCGSRSRRAPRCSRKVLARVFWDDMHETLEAAERFGVEALHQLTGDRRGQWSVRVSGNWRIVFRFVDGIAVDVDLIDYH